jgi:hypothetical protein
MSNRLVPALFAILCMARAQDVPGAVWNNARFEALLRSRLPAPLVADDGLLAANAALAARGLSGQRPPCFRERLPMGFESGSAMERRMSCQHRKSRHKSI